MSETKRPEPLPGMLPEVPLAECRTMGHMRYVRMRREIYDAGDLRALLAWLPDAVAWVAWVEAGERTEAKCNTCGSTRKEGGE